MESSKKSFDPETAWTVGDELEDLNDARRANYENAVSVFGPPNNSHRQHMTPINPRNATESPLISNDKDNA